MTQKDWSSHYERLEKALNKLRVFLLIDSPKAAEYIRWFDEWLEHREYELAMHAICDFALEPDYPSLTAELADELIALHIAMEIDDDCGMKLREAAKKRK